MTAYEGMIFVATLSWVGLVVLAYVFVVQPTAPAERAPRCVLMSE